MIFANRRPGLIFGRHYQNYCKFLQKNYSNYNNVDLLLKRVNSAIKIPFYASKYKDLSLRSLGDFEDRISFIDKEDILANYDKFINPNISMNLYDTGTTGGTSGKPLKLIVPKHRYVVEFATMHFLWKNAGYNFDVRAVIRNHKLPEGKKYVINPITREVIFDGFRLTDDYFALISRIIKKMDIRFVHCYPSVAYEYSVFIRDRIKERLPINAFLSGSENIFDYQRSLIEGELGIRFYNWYGHSEKLVLAGYCQSTHCYHAEPTYGYFELIDENNRPIHEPGKTGEIVGTAFHNPGMPLIRYRTGDYAEYVGDYCESCGRHLPIFKNVRGRWHGDRIYNADGSFITTTALNLHNDLYQVINGIQYIQKIRGKLTVLIVKSTNYNSEHEKALIRHFKERMNPDSRVSIAYVDKLIKKENGKFLQLISEIP